MIEKTLAMRALEGKKIPYEALSYPDDMRDAEEIAIMLDLPPEQVFKTLVVLPPEGTKKPILALVPANAQLDLKKLAEATRAKKLKMSTHREAEQLTGLQVGGISALALLNKPFVVFVDHSAAAVDKICVSAGKRGLQIRLGVDDLVKVTNARLANITGAVG